MIEPMPEAKDGQDGGARAIPYSYEDILAEIDRQNSSQSSWVKNLVLVAISLILFFQLGLIQSGPRAILYLIAVLLAHETGHFIGMRLFGYRNVRMFFIPFFGAAVSGRSSSVASYKKAMVSLMGPVPGILLGLLLWIFFRQTHSLPGIQFSLLFLGINAFNLLPFYPLDGGRFFHEVLFCRNRYIDLFFRLLASLGLIGAGYFMKSWMFGIFGAFSLLALPIFYKLSGIISDIRQAMAYNRDMAESDDSDTLQNNTLFHMIVGRIVQRFPKEIKLRQLADYAQHVFDGIHTRPPGILASAGLTGVYLASWILLFGVLADFIEIYRQTNIETKIVEYKNSNGETGRKEQLYRSGLLRRETELSEDGTLYHGRLVSYHRDGTVDQEGYWSGGKRDGEWKDYDSRGNLIRVTVFDHGDFVSQREKDGSRWVKKSWRKLSFLKRKAYASHRDGPPEGPEKKFEAPEPGEIQQEVQK